MLNPWDPQTAPIQNTSDIYNYNLNNTMGLGAPNTWTSAQLQNINQIKMAGLNPQGVDWTGLNQVAGIDPNTGKPLLDVTRGLGNTTITFNPSSARFGAGGGPGMGGSAPASGSSATSGSAGLSGTSSGFTSSSLGLSGASGASGAAGAAGAGSGVAGATTGSTAASGGFWGAAKGVLSNKALLSGIVTGLSSAYGQYQQKAAAKDNYKWQNQQLADQRAYQQQLYEQRQNSPGAQMSRALLQYYMPIYIEKIKSHNKGANSSALDALLASMMGGA